MSVGLGDGDGEGAAGLGRVEETSAIARAGSTLGTSGDAVAGAGLAVGSTSVCGSMTTAGCTWAAITAPGDGPDGTGDAATNGARPITTTSPIVMPTTV